MQPEPEARRRRRRRARREAVAFEQRPREEHQGVGYGSAAFSLRDPPTVSQAASAKSAKSLAAAKFHTEHAAAAPSVPIGTEAYHRVFRDPLTVLRSELNVEPSALAFKREGSLQDARLHNSTGQRIAIKVGPLALSLTSPYCRFAARTTSCTA